MLRLLSFYGVRLTGLCAAATLSILMLISAAPAKADPIGVLTYHYDNLRTGWNPNETVLTTSNVTPSQFGLEFSVPLDAESFGQPLYVPHVTIQGAPHNIVVVATENATVYAIDADSGAVLWRHPFAPGSGITPVTRCECLKKCDTTQPQGLTGTPVIDIGTDSIYVVARTNESSGGPATLHYRLHALQLETGKDRTPPVQIALSATASNGAKLRLSVACNLQRPGLAEANGLVYVAFGSQGDQAPLTTTGWLAAFDPQTLAPAGALPAGATTAGGRPQKLGVQGGGLGLVRLASVWMSGAAPAIDSAGNLYVQTGNGAFDGALDWGMSLLKVAPTLSGVLDYFTPSTYAYDNDHDVDLGSAGVLLLPQPVGGYEVAVGGGKRGVTFLLNTANLGKLQRPGHPTVLFAVQTNDGLWGTPAAYIGADGNTYVIVPGSGPMTSWEVTAAPSPALVKVGATPDSFGQGDNGGSIPVISSNGVLPGTAIVWAYSRPVPPAEVMLRAYDASNLSHELIDVPFTYWKGPNPFITPLVANGSVYACGESVLNVYGLMARARRPPR